MKKVLLTGANGQVGTYVQKLSANHEEIEIISLTRDELDLSDIASILEAVVKYKPDVVINAAAYTAVDRAEEERELAMTINGIAVGEIAKACEIVGASLIQISTDYVFNGQKDSEYYPNDQTDPINYYGETKLVGEELAVKYCSEAVIVRTSWVHSDVGVNFETTMRKLFAEREELNIINDQIGRPTHARDLANHCLELALESHLDTKITHFAGDYVMSWFDLAEKIFSTVDQPLTKVINPISSSEYPTSAKRPKNSVLALS